MVEEWKDGMKLVFIRGIVSPLHGIEKSLKVDFVIDSHRDQNILHKDFILQNIEYQVSASK